MKSLKDIGFTIFELNGEREILNDATSITLSTWTNAKLISHNQKNLHCRF